MNKSIELLKKWHIEEPKRYESVAPLNSVNKLFSIKEKTILLKKEQTDFLKKMQKECNNCLSVDTNGSGRYFFKAGKSILELFIFIENNNMKLEPYLIYNDKEVKNDIQRVLHKEYIIFCLLKKWGLQ